MQASSTLSWIKSNSSMDLREFSTVKKRSRTLIRACNTTTRTWLSSFVRLRRPCWLPSGLFYRRTLSSVLWVLWHCHLRWRIRWLRLAVCCLEQIHSKLQQKSYRWANIPSTICHNMNDLPFIASLVFNLLRNDTPNVDSLGTLTTSVTASVLFRFMLGYLILFLEGKALHPGTWKILFRLHIAPNCEVIFSIKFLTEHRESSSRFC